MMDGKGQVRYLRKVTLPYRQSLLPTSKECKAKYRIFWSHLPTNLSSKREGVRQGPSVWDSLGSDRLGAKSLGSSMRCDDSPEKIYRDHPIINWRLWEDESMAFGPL